jgi:hypothetical protein
MPTATSRGCSTCCYGPHETLLRFDPGTATNHPQAVTAPSSRTDGDEILIRPDGQLP